MIDRWRCFYSEEEHWLYKWNDPYWIPYSAVRISSHIQQYVTTIRNLQSEPVSANKLVSANPRSNNIVLDSKVALNFTLPDEDPIFVDYESGPFLTFKDAFDSSVDCRQILIDKYHLPRDNCEAILEGIKCGTDQAISNGYFYLKDKLWTSLMIIVADKKDTNNLTCRNWVNGVKEDQNLCKRKLSGINGVLVKILMIICYFNFTQGEIKKQ